jgi:hypothetical protein
MGMQFYSFAVGYIAGALTIVAGIIGAGIYLVVAANHMED